MKIFKLFLGIILAITISFFLTSCNKSQENPNTVRVGTIAGPETQLMETAQHVALQRYGLNIQIVQFTDYSMPNEALADGSIDANMFQHLPYLDAAIQAKGYKITPIAKTFIYPMAIYSNKIKSLADLQSHATVAVPNDPSNEARALLLLEKAKLITLQPGSGTNATVVDIAKNPDQLSFKEVDAAQLPRVLPDVDIAVINTNYAMLAGLTPSKDGLFVESTDSPYANIVVVRTDQVNDPRFAKLIEALHSPEVVQEANQLFHGQAIPAWRQ